MNNTELKQLSDTACDRILDILNYLKIEYFASDCYIHMCCPIHGGDNETGLWFSFSTNHWTCETRHCEQDNITGKSSSVFGLVRGILSKKMGKQVSFKETIDSVRKMLPLLVNVKSVHHNRSNVSIDPSNIKYPTLDQHQRFFQHDRDYYPQRGISKEIIERYNISVCNKRGKPFYKRIFFPILDHTGEFIVGYSARSIYDQCSNCKKYHHPGHDCHFYDKRRRGLKWIHSRGFQKTLCLYNLWYSKVYIQKTKTCVICEGPGDCWKYESVGIKNSVSILGTSMSKAQVALLKSYGATNIVLTLDNDKAGIAAREKIMERYGEEFNIRYITLPRNDIGDMSAEEILELKL